MLNFTAAQDMFNETVAFCCKECGDFSEEEGQPILPSNAAFSMWLALAIVTTVFFILLKKTTKKKRATYVRMPKRGETLAEKAHKYELLNPDKYVVRRRLPFTEQRTEEEEPAAPKNTPSTPYCSNGADIDSDGEDCQPRRHRTAREKGRPAGVVANLLRERLLLTEAREEMEAMSKFKLRRAVRRRLEVDQGRRFSREAENKMALADEMEYICGEQRRTVRFSPDTKEE